MLLNSTLPPSISPTPYTPYTPVSFNSDLPTALAIIREHPFASLITVHNNQTFVTQIPFVMRDQHTLIAHMARANSHSQALVDETSPIDAVIQFSGVNGYISPTWYKLNTGVPTWNYQTVQVRGQIKLADTAALTESVVKTLIEAFDINPELTKHAWAHLPVKSQQLQLGAILAFEVNISQLHPKSKLSQNKQIDERMAIIHALEQGGANDQSLAQAMRKAMQS